MRSSWKEQSLLDAFHPLVNGNGMGSCNLQSPQPCWDADRHLYTKEHTHVTHICFALIFPSTNVNSVPRFSMRRFHEHDEPRMCNDVSGDEANLCRYSVHSLCSPPTEAHFVYSKGTSDLMSLRMRSLWAHDSHEYYNTAFSSTVHAGRQSSMITLTLRRESVLLLRFAIVTRLFGCLRQRGELRLLLFWVSFP